MAFVDRTAYPRLLSAVSVRELAEVFTPTAEEVIWACAKVVGPGSRLALLVMLKCYQRLGYFPQIDRVPPEVVEYVCAQAVEVVGDRVGPLGRQSDRMIRRCRELVREYTGAVWDPGYGENPTGIRR
jgi:Domain of unknown function (DUF4158)